MILQDAWQEIQDEIHIQARVKTEELLAMNNYKEKVNI